MEDIDLDEGLGRSSEGCYFGERMVGGVKPPPPANFLDVPSNKAETAINFDEIKNGTILIDFFSGPSRTNGQWESQNHRYYKTTEFNSIQFPPDGRQSNINPFNRYRIWDTRPYQARIVGPITGGRRGGGPMPQKDLLQKIAYQSYSKRPTRQIGNLTLVSYTPTLKIYKAGDNTFVVGIRGTESKQDIKADSLLAVGQLEQSARYKDDANTLLKFQSYYPPSHYDYYGVGHSLGGAILDVFLSKGMVKNGVSYNPAIQPQSLLSNSTSNERIYAENDPLYKLFGDKLLVKPEVRKRKEKTMFESVVSAIPYAGKVYDLFQGHTLGQFEGGNVCLTKSAFIKEHKKLIGLLEKVGKEGKEQKKELQRVMKK